MNPNVSYEQIHSALIDALNPTDLAVILRSRFHVRLESIVPPGTWTQVVFGVVEHAERAGWLDELVEAVYRERPRNPQIAELYNRLGLAPRVSVQNAGNEVPWGGGLESVESGGFEAVVGRQSPTIDLDSWTAGAARVADRVCRVEHDGQPIGTGFLVGPDAVLTCDFVLEKLLANKKPPESYTFRFDYKVLASGIRSDGVAVGLNSEKWLIDSSPFSPDENARLDVLPSKEQIGFALVRLTYPIGKEPPGRNIGGDCRGWIEVPSTPLSLLKSTPVIIAHYPAGGPLKITFDSAGMIGPNANNTRVRYTASTEPGSSGAPCFDVNWVLFAVHQLSHRGTGQKQGFQQGISIAAIRARLEQQGKTDALRDYAQ